MTRLLTCGWETNDPNETGVLGGGWLCVNTAPVPKAPSQYYLRANTNGVYKSFSPWTPKTELYIRFHVYLTSLGNVFLYLYDSAGSQQLNMSVVSATRLLQINSATTLTGTIPCDVNIWHLIELHWKATTTTSSTDGTIRVWQDGTLVINNTAVDSTQTSNLNVRSMNFYSYYSDSQFDDVAVNDTLGTINNGQIGDGSVVLLLPNGPGSNTNQTRGGTDSGANWSQCDELPPAMTDYVQSATVGARDTYALTDIPAGAWTVNAVEPFAWAQNSDTGTGSIGLTVVSGATTNEAAAQTLAISPVYVRQLYETDPNTGAAWTNAAVNAMELGTTVR